MKRIILFFVILLLISCENLKITRYGYTFDEKFKFDKKKCKPLFHWKLPIELLDTNDLKLVGEVMINSLYSNLEEYLSKEACIAKANLVDVVFEERINELYSDYSAKLFYLKPNSITMKRLDIYDIDTLNYYPNIKLTWDDFKGEPDYSDSNKASLLTNISLHYDVEVWFGTLDLIYSGVVYRDKSWVKPEYKNESNLQHYQLLFDISELMAIKYENEVKEKNINIVSRGRVRNLYYKYLIELYKYQNLYEKETNYGQDKVQQMIWNKKIAKELEDMREKVKIK